MSVIGISSRVITTMASMHAATSAKVEVAYNNETLSSISRNVSDMDILIAGLWDFYDNLNGEANYVLIILYVPVMILAVTANILVITVVFKYHYMRRYVRVKLLYTVFK